MERWLNINEFPNYDVSSDGRVRNNRTGRILKPGITVYGYEIVVLSNEYGRKTKSVHRLVADAFYDGNHDDYVVDHVDGNKRNNFIGNLEFCTSGENNLRAYRTGLKKPVRAINQPSNRKVRVVETGEEYYSVKECARCIGANHRHISDCLNGKLSKHHGYHYEEIK